MPGPEGQYGYPPPSDYPQPNYPGYGGYPMPAYPTPAYPQVGGYQPDQDAPFGYDQLGRPYSDKQKLIAGLLQILVGGLGIGRFYTGHTGIGIAQLVVTLFTCGLGAIWGLVDGILILVNGGTDAQGRPLRDS